MSGLQQASASYLPPGITDPNYKPLPGRLGNLTIPQQHALGKLKKEIIEAGAYVEGRMDDAMFLRFLRARKFDVQKSKEMLLAAEQWRRDFGVDDIVKNFDFKEKREVDKYYPQFYHRTDKDGRPIYIERLGSLDIKALYAATTPDRQLKRLVFEYEKSATLRFPQCSAASGHPVETSCTILDLAGVSLTNFYRVKDYVFQASSISQDRYPETMGRFFIVNAPWAFSAVWGIVKGWLDQETVSKIDILGGGVAMERVLVEHIGKENLPRELGGSCICDCEGGCSLSDAGPWNPVPRVGEKVEEEEVEGRVTVPAPAPA